MGATIDIDFEGEVVAAQAGESLAAALTAHGVKAFRTTRTGAERGVFCGMGICQDCLVEVDGAPNQRACMTKIDRPMRVRREAHARPLAPSLAAPPAITGARDEGAAPELLVIGAGPGGLSAAIAARNAGADVLVVDERADAGGQYFKQLSVDAAEAVPPDAQHHEGAGLIARAVRHGVAMRFGVTVWGAFASNEFAATARGLAFRLTPKAAILATGAYERGWPIPGWTLPGVMTTGAAQTLWRTARRLAGRRVLIAGNGPLNLQLAAELIAGGAQIAAVVEAAEGPSLRKIRALATMALTSPNSLRDGLRYHSVRRSAGVEMIHAMVVSKIEQTAGGLGVRLSPVGGASAERLFEVDAVCLGYGFEPANELLRALGCSHGFDPRRGGLVTTRNADGLTDVAGVYALGDCAGLGGARAAMADGAVVGLAAARALGHSPGASLVAEADRARSGLARHSRFQRALWDLYAAPPYSASLAAPETLICRCEEVTFAQVEQALDEGMRSAGAVKRCTRIGMGRCQGRYCAPVLEALMAERFSQPRDEFSGFAPRLPVKPVAIDDLAQLGRQ